MSDSASLHRSDSHGHDSHMLQNQATGKGQRRHGNEAHPVPGEHMTLRQSIISPAAHSSELHARYMLPTFSTFKQNLSLPQRKVKVNQSVRVRLPWVIYSHPNSRGSTSTTGVYPPVMLRTPDMGKMPWGDSTGSRVIPGKLP